MPATRSTRSSAAAKAGKAKSATGTVNSSSDSKVKTTNDDEPTGPPPKVILLPKDDNDDDKRSPYTILSLPHPRTKTPTRYLLHPTRKSLLYEITKVREPSSRKRSWLIHNPELAEKAPIREIEDKEYEEEAEDGNDETDIAKDYEALGRVIKEAVLFVTSPIDILYLLLPHLMEGKTSRNFITLDDIFESHPQTATWDRIMKSSPEAEQMVHNRIKAVCDTVSVGDEDMYRLNSEKLLGLLYSRLERMSDRLPASLTAVVTSQLAKPLKAQVSVQPQRKSENANGEDGVIDDKQLEEEVKAETGEGKSDNNTPVESQKSQVASLRSEVSSLSINSSSNTSEVPSDRGTSTPVQGQGQGPGHEITAETLAQHEPPPPNVLKLANIVQALSFLLIYVPTNFRQTLTDHVDKLHPPEELKEYRAELSKLRADAAAAIEASMLHTKRTLEDLEGGARDRLDAEQEKKKRKKEEDARKSSGVKKLEKVNTKGMSKMTSFFKKKE